MPSGSDYMAAAPSPLAWPPVLPVETWQHAVKRGLDVLLAGTALLLLLPLLLVIAVLIKLDSTGPVLYTSTRLGKRGKPFTMWKFRSMCPGADGLKGHLQHLNTLQGPVFKMKADPRVTRLGKWLRRASLDELPQLWNIVVGDMALVGPRPPLPEEAADYASWHWRRLDVTPGLTGLWQVEARASEPDFNRWVAYDLRYIDEWSLWLDLRIIARTVPAVLRGHGAY